MRATSSPTGWRCTPSPNVIPSFAGLLDRSTLKRFCGCGLAEGAGGGELHSFARSRRFAAECGASGAAAPEQEAELPSWLGNRAEVRSRRAERAFNFNSYILRGPKWGSDFKAPMAPGFQGRPQAGRRE